MPNHRAEDVLAFWFGEGADYGRRHKRWFEKQTAFDAEVAQRFLGLYEPLSRKQRTRTGMPLRIATSSGASAASPIATASSAALAQPRSSNSSSSRAQASRSVMAPSDAVETSFMYLAISPRV